MCHLNWCPDKIVAALSEEKKQDYCAGKEKKHAASGSLPSFTHLRCTPGLSNPDERERLSTLDLEFFHKGAEQLFIFGNGLAQDYAEVRCVLIIYHKIGRTRKCLQIIKGFEFGAKQDIKDIAPS
jgi:hypothetical protein